VTDTRFAPGAGTAYLGDTTLALIEAADVDDDVVRLVTTADWDALADAVRERHVGALVMHDAGLVRVAVAGGASVLVETADGPRRFHGADTWHTDTVDHARSVTLTTDRAVVDTAVAAPTAVSTPYRTDAGVVPAAVVCRRLAHAEVEAEPADPFEVLFGHTVARSVESAAVRPGDDARATRAPLGVLVFATGERVVVDRPIVLGRNPRPGDVGDVGDAGDATPRLVKLALAGVSRRHAAIRLDRWTASIADLGSVNGTTVAMPGRPATRLRPGNPIDLVVGAVVDLGGEVSFTVEEAA
jgi:FHA domain